LAQSKQAPVLIGWLSMTGSRASSGQLFEAFKEGLAALGWKEGTQVVFDDRWADGREDRAQALAVELAARKPAIIVASPAQAVIAAARAAPGTPIVQAVGGDPVATGLVASLARPGGMVTGLSNMAVDITEKHVELLLAVAPRLRHVGFLVNPVGVTKNRLKQSMQRSVERYKVSAYYAEAARREDIEPALSQLAKQGALALVVQVNPLFFAERRGIVSAALARRWPMIGGMSEWAKDGSLLSYGVDLAATCRRAAYYVDRILKGARPGDLPIEQPRVELIVNLRTARALKIDIPREIAARADRVIE
jgi:putative ABC transport system substrate-binding protein